MMCGGSPLGAQARHWRSHHHLRSRHALVVVDLEPDSDPPRVLAIGPDQAGNLLEVIWLEFPDREPIVIHAMRLRRTFYDLLPSGEDDS